DRGGDGLHARGHVVDALADEREGVARPVDARRAGRRALGAGLDHLRGARGDLLHLADEPADRPGRGLGLLGELADLLGDDREAATSSVVARAHPVRWTWVSAPRATSATASAISATARPVCSDAPAISCDVPDTLSAPRATRPIASARALRVSL